LGLGHFTLILIVFLLVTIGFSSSSFSQSSEDNTLSRTRCEFQPSIAESAKTEIRIEGSKVPVFGEDTSFTVFIKGELQDGGLVSLKVIEQLDKSVVLYEDSKFVTKGFPQTNFDLPIKFPMFGVGQTSVVEVRNGDAFFQCWITPMKHETAIDPQGNLIISQREEPVVRIYGLIEREMENRWLAFLEICAGKDRLTAPTVRIMTDLDDTEVKLAKVVNAGSCGSINEFDVVAKDPNSVIIEYVGLSQKYGVLGEDVDKLKAENSEMKDEIKELKKKLEKKDAVLMEQLKVISDLASMLKNTIFEKLSSFLNHL